MELDLELYPFVAPKIAPISWGMRFIVLFVLICLVFLLYVWFRRYTSARARLKRECARLIKNVNNTENPRLYLDGVSSALRNYIQIVNNSDAVWHMTDQEIIDMLLVDSVRFDGVFVEYIKALELMKFAPGSIDKNQLLRILKSIAVI